MKENCISTLGTKQYDEIYSSLKKGTFNFKTDTLKEKYKAAEIEAIRKIEMIVYEEG